MYPAFDWSICSGHHGISARVRSRYGQARWTIWVTSVRMRRERPNLHHVYLSQTSLEIVDRVTSSLAPHTAQFLCSSPGPFLRPARRTSIASRAGAVKAGRCAWLAAALRCQAGALTAPSTARGSSGSDACIVGPRQLEARPLASTAQAMRASLLASAIASTLWCNRLLAASIQDLSP